MAKVIFTDIGIVLSVIPNSNTNSLLYLLFILIYRYVYIYLPQFFFYTYRESLCIYKTTYRRIAMLCIYKNYS